MANLLIVDDDASIRTFLALVLRQDGHNVLEAESGESCLAQVQAHALELVLLDAQMPGMDGFTCCADLRTTLGASCPPIIMITGLADKDSVDRAFAVGAIDYATKPVHVSVLKHRIRQVLRERELVTHLASVNQQLATANRELQKLTRIDSLTQVANRRYFREILLAEWALAARQKHHLSVLLCDVDFFKEYNDCYGHVGGDRCLQEVSQILKQSALRPSDLVARYGGEEFVLILPETDAQGAYCIAQRIHVNLSKAALPHARSKISDFLTLSIGGACTMPTLSLEPETLIDAADKALYLAKARGRNQIVFEEDLQYEYR
jgi:diguanylate cyclase (GGDEF)-like protein